MSSLARRQVLTGLAGLPLATVLADPRLARAAAAGLDDVSIATAGGATVGAALALPKSTPASAVMLVHEWWGLNDQIKSVAAELAKQGYVALAIDLSRGKVADTPDGARGLMNQVDDAAATDTVVSWIDWLRAHPRSTGKIATIGWCFGGGWSLNTALLFPEDLDAAVIYYGQVTDDESRLSPLQVPLLGLFGAEDRGVRLESVQAFEAALERLGKEYEIHVYEGAGHAFANPSGTNFNAEYAEDAWKRTLGFLGVHLGKGPT